MTVNYVLISFPLLREIYSPILLSNAIWVSSAYRKCKHIPNSGFELLFGLLYWRFCGYFLCQYILYRSSMRFCVCYSLSDSGNEIKQSAISAKGDYYYDVLWPLCFLFRGESPAHEADWLSLSHYIVHGVIEGKESSEFVPKNDHNVYRLVSDNSFNVCIVLVVIQGDVNNVHKMKHCGTLYISFGLNHHAKCD